MPTRSAPRSYLLTPASNPAMIAKAAGSPADAVCIDLEDAVAPGEKEASRAHVIRALRELDFGLRLRLFRINALDTPFAYRDLIEVIEEAGDRLDLVIVPKVDRVEDVLFVDTLLSQIEWRQRFAPGRIGIEAQIETALGCVNVDRSRRPRPGSTPWSSGWAITRRRCGCRSTRSASRASTIGPTPATAGTM